MRAINGLAASLMDHAARIMPATRSSWIRAMRAELHFISSPAEAALFALGCLQASYAERITDMLTVARLSRWILTLLALAWSGFTAGVAGLFLMIKTNPKVTAADLGQGPDGQNEETLRFIRAYPTWEFLTLIILAVLMTVGAVQLLRRKASALTMLAMGVGGAAFLAIYDRRLPDPAFNRPLDSNELILFWFLCLGVAWWLSRRAPDLKPV